MDTAHALLLDVGGHSLRAALVNRAGRIIAMERRDVETRRPGPGRVEHDADALVAGLRDALDSLARAHRAAAMSVVAAGLSCQRASVVCWDRASGAALSPVISWQDARGAALLDAAALDAADVARRTGMRPSVFLGASKLAWCRQHLDEVAGAAAQARLCWGPLGSFLLHRLLRERPYACPSSLAQRSMLFDPAGQRWDAALCARFAIDPASLPQAQPDIGAFGTLDFAGRALPLRLCAGDQNLLPAALSLAADQVVVNLGTGAFILAGGDAPSTELLHSVVPGVTDPPALIMEGTVHGAAAALSWWAAQDAGALPGEIPPSTAATPHFLDSVGGLGSPLWLSGVAPRFSAAPDSSASGRAAIADAIVHLLMLNLQAMRRCGLGAGRIYAGGGLAAEAGLLQRLADVADAEVLRPRNAELSLAGAAALLGCAALPDGDCDRFVPAASAALAGQRWRAWCGWMAEVLGSGFVSTQRPARADRLP